MCLFNAHFILIRLELKMSEKESRGRADECAKILGFRCEVTALKLFFM